MELRAPIARPDIIIADAGPLIHLAQADALPLLHQIGGRVVVPDMVAFEVTQDLSKPGAERLRAWLDAGQIPGSNAPISIEETSTGRLFALARQADPAVKARDAGERAIVDWLAEKVAGTDLEAVVVYENGKVPRIIANQAMDANIDVVTTRAFLKIAEERSLLTDAAGYWRRVAEHSPTANPADVVTMHRRLKP